MSMRRFEPTTVAARRWRPPPPPLSPPADAAGRNTGPNATSHSRRPQQKRSASRRLHGKCKTYKGGSKRTTQMSMSIATGAISRAVHNALRRGPKQHRWPHTGRLCGQGPTSSAGGGAGAGTIARTSSGTAMCGDARTRSLFRWAVASTDGPPRQPQRTTGHGHKQPALCEDHGQPRHGVASRGQVPGSSTRPSARRLRAICRRPLTRGRNGRPFLMTPALLWLPRPAHLAPSPLTCATNRRRQVPVPLAEHGCTWVPTGAPSGITRAPHVLSESWEKRPESPKGLMGGGTKTTLLGSPLGRDATCATTGGGLPPPMLQPTPDEVLNLMEVVHGKRPQCRLCTPTSSTIMRCRQPARPDKFGPAATRATCRSPTTMPT